MSEAACKSLLDHFAGLNDRRQAAKVLYPLPEILLLLLSATLASANDCVEMEFWGREQLPFLRRFLPYRHGVPSHDTLNGVLAALDPTLFKACFVSWFEGLREAEPDLVAINGKTSRRSHARGKGREPLHLVSAWASRQRLVLGQAQQMAKEPRVVDVGGRGDGPSGRPSVATTTWYLVPGLPRSVGLGTVRNFVCGPRVEHSLAQAIRKRSSNRIAN